MNGKRVAGVACIAVAVVGCAATIYFAQGMRMRGERFWTRMRAAESPEKQREILAEGYVMPPSKVGQRTIPAYTGCAVIAILGLMFFRDARKRDKEAQPSPEAYSSKASDGLTGNAQE